MARTNQGILGSFNGAIGPITGYVRNGQNIIRTRSSGMVYKHTPMRTAQLEKMKICNRFTRALSRKGFFNTAFSAYGSTNNGYNRATSVLLNQAIMGSYPNLYLDYSKALISKGKLPPATDAAVALVDDAQLKFSFTVNNETGTASGYDRLILVAYAPDLNQAIATLNGGMRKDGSALLNISAFKGNTVHTWIGFINSDGSNASDSVYTEVVEVGFSKH